MYWEHNHAQSVHCGSQHWPKWTMYYHVKKVFCPPTLSNRLLLAPFLFLPFQEFGLFTWMLPNAILLDWVGWSPVNSTTLQETSSYTYFEVCFGCGLTIGAALFLRSIWSACHFAEQPKPSILPQKPTQLHGKHWKLTESKSIPSCLPATAVSLAVLCTILSPLWLGKPFVLSFRCCDKS